MNFKRFIPVLLLVAAATALSACGARQGTADKAAEQASSEAANPPTITDATTPSVTAEGELKVKPVIPRQSGAAPTKLIVQDVIVGTGAQAKSGDTVIVQYVGVLFSNGKEFDSSWKAGKPFDFVLGSGGVIAGWDRGVEGMRVGGRRRLIIPADLAYGADGSPPTIPADAALVFDVDLLKVTAG